MNSGLDGKVVLVTGASGGIGSRIAHRFAEEGAKVVLHFRSNRRSIRELGKLCGENAITVQADLTSEAEVQKLFASALKRFGRIDTLIANAGAWQNADIPLHKMSTKQWRTTLDNVLTSTFLTLREFLRIVEKQKAGNAVLIGSTAAVFGEDGHADYAAGKAAMTFGLTRTLKNEIARIAPTRSGYCGGRINCICPGWTEIERTAEKLKKPATVKRVSATMSLRKLAQPDDIANAALFLSSDLLAGHITGQIMVIAGGMEGRLLWP